MRGHGGVLLTTRSATVCVAALSEDIFVSRPSGLIPRKGTINKRIALPALVLAFVLDVMVSRVLINQPRYILCPPVRVLGPVLAVAERCRSEALLCTRRRRRAVPVYDRRPP